MFSILLLYCFFLGTVPLSQEKSEIWRPRLKADVVLPTRYFYIQAVDTSGNNFTSSPGEKVFQVKVSAPEEQFTRVRVQVLDQKDGSFIVRYRMCASYKNLKVEVKFQGQNVAKSPCILKGPVCHENCDCPLQNSAAWLWGMNCSDLAHFPTVDPEKIAVEIPKRFGQRKNLCHYTLKGNRVCIKTDGEHGGFRIFMDAILLSLTRKMKMPDTEFFVNLADWPLLWKKKKSNLTDSVLETMGWVSLDMMSVQRGQDSHKERFELVQLRRKHPELIDTAFTNFFFFKHDDSLCGPIVKHISFFDFFEHKYQINIDGTVAAYLSPKHYIPVKSNLSDLLEKLKWAKDDDEKAKKIAKARQEFARNNLMDDNIVYYYFKLFQEYGMKRVEPQTENNLFPCTCHRKKTKDEL
uniref:Glycosyl transferase CAP10 domain-containing protein n=1 Tax=Rhinopithecus roxellana TaxID=61622 RepID=A0A2K6QJ98_RHIRO